MRSVEAGATLMRYRQLGASGLRVLVLTMQLADNLGAADLALAGPERARLEEVSRPPLLYPYWHQAKTASDRLGAADLSLLGPHLGG
jgi:hypothetical protein